MDEREVRMKIDMVTCEGCRFGYPLENGWHDTWDDGSIHMPCTSRADVIIPIIKAEVSEAQIEALEEAARGFENLHWALKTNQEAANCIRTLKDVLTEVPKP